MTKLLASAVALALISGSAIAADLPLPPIVAPLPEAFSWTGFYGGLAGGYAWGNAEVNVNGGPGDEEFDGDGWMLGAFAGFNYQIWRSVVTGIEADIEWVDIDGDDDGDDDDGPDLSDIGFEVNWQGSIRGRLGYAFDRVLVYGTGGFALADIDTDGSGDDDDDSGTEWGWTLGAGVDYAVTQNIFLRGEYRYTDLSDFDNDDEGREVQDLDSHALRIGVGVLF